MISCKFSRMKSSSWRRLPNTCLTGFTKLPSIRQELPLREKDASLRLHQQVIFLLMPSNWTWRNVLERYLRSTRRQLHALQRNGTTQSPCLPLNSWKISLACGILKVTRPIVSDSRWRKFFLRGIRKLILPRWFVYSMTMVRFAARNCLIFVSLAGHCHSIPFFLSYSISF